jgi:glutathione S-transferase
MTNLTLIGSSKTRAFRVLFLLEELGLPFTHISAAPHSSQARDANPAGKVPCLLVDDVALTDSTAIMTYLADHAGQFTTPAGSLARAKQDSICQFVLDELDATLWMAAKHSFVLPEEMRLPAIKDSLKWDYQRSLTRLAARLEGPFLSGAAPTIADFITTHCLTWGIAIKFPMPDDKLMHYLSVMTQRPAYQRAMAR